MHGRKGRIEHINLRFVSLLKTGEKRNAPPFGETQGSHAPARFARDSKNATHCVPTGSPSEYISDGAPVRTPRRELAPGIGVSSAQGPLGNAFDNRRLCPDNDFVKKNTNLVPGAVDPQNSFD
jgi:hypothetical protein